MVTVKNYNNSDEITQTSLTYELDVISTDEAELPEYYLVIQMEIIQVQQQKENLDVPQKKKRNIK